MTNNQIADNVYPMWQAAGLAQNLAHLTAGEDNRTTIKTSLPSLDEILNPVIGGSLITNIGRPSNGKTLFSNYLLMETMKTILEKEKRNQTTNEICILITAETSVEVTALTWMSRYTGIPVRKVLRGLSESDLVKMDNNIGNVMGLPLFIIGHSTQRTKDGRKEPPNITPDKINEGIEYILNEFKNPITNQNYEIKFIITDYLHSLQKPEHVSERSFYSQTVGWAKKLSIWTDAVHMLNVQARREVDDREIKIPTIRDGMETSSIEHFSQVSFATHIPNFYGIQTMPSMNGGRVPELLVTKYLMYIALLKQQEGEANFVVPVEIDFNNHTLKEINLDEYRY